MSVHCDPYATSRFSLWRCCLVQNVGHGMDETNCFVGSNGRTSKRQAFFLFLECSTDGSGGWIPYETMDDLAELYKQLNRSDTEADVNAEFCAVLLNTFSQLQVNLDSPRADVVPLRRLVYLG